MKSNKLPQVMTLESASVGAGDNRFEDGNNLEEELKRRKFTRQRLEAALAAPSEPQTELPAVDLHRNVGARL